MPLLSVLCLTIGIFLWFITFRLLLMVPNAALLSVLDCKIHCLDYSPSVSQYHCEARFQKGKKPFTFVILYAMVCFLPLTIVSMCLQLLKPQ